jgi:O-antigen/teichoic acid export membrane protein
MPFTTRHAGHGLAASAPPGCEDPPGRALALNTAWLTLTELATKVLSLLLIIFVARRLGPAMMGIYAFALTFIQLFEIFINYGLDRYIQREVGRRPQVAGPLFSQVFWLKTLTAGLSWLAILLLSYFLIDSPLKRWVVWILSLTVFFRAHLASANAFFRAFLTARYEALATLTLRVVYTSTGLFAILSGYGLLTLVSLELAATVGACGLGWYMFVTKFGLPRYRADFSTVLKLARAAKNFLLIRLVLVVFNSLDLLMLSWLAGDLTTGFYAVALRLTSAFDFLPEALTGAFLPVLSRKAKESWHNFAAVFQPYYKYLLILGVGLAAGLSGLARPGLGWVFGPAYLPAVNTLMILALALALDFVNRALSTAVIALDAESRLVGNFAGAAGLKIVLNLIFIPLWQHLGAALATLISEVLVLVLQLHTLGWLRLKTLSLPGLSLKPVLAGLLTFSLALWLSLREFPLAAAILVASLSFLIFLILTRAISRQELAGLRDLATRSKA